jgi:PAS domain S-box-containing protein
MSPVAATAFPLARWWELSDDLCCVLDDRFVVAAVNPSFERTLGWTPDQLLGSSVSERMHPEDVAIGLQGQSAPAGRDRMHNVPTRCRHADGTWRWILWTAVHEDGAWYCIGKNVTEHRERDRDLGVREGRSQAMLRALPDGVCVIDADGTIVTASERFCEMTGFAVEDLLGTRPPYAFWPPEHMAEIMRAYRAARVGGTGRYDLVFCRKNGERFPILGTTSALGDPAPGGFLAVIRDVSDERLERDRLRAAREYERAVTASMGEGLYAVDTDGRLLYMNPAAERLLGWRQDDLAGKHMHETIHFVGRDGGAVPAEQCALLQARRHGTVVHIEDDIFIRKDGTQLPVAITCTSIEAAGGGRGSVVVFTDVTERHAREARVREEGDRASWVDRIRDALADDRFELHAQPIVELASGDTVTHELLIRMRDPAGRLIPPGDFLPAAEASGLIVDIDRWVITQAAEIAACGHRVEVNLSAESVGSPVMLRHFKDTLESYATDASLIVIELTETAMLRDEAAAERFIDQVRALGCKLALDDFGTGYGGFTYLKRLPVDYLKIDVEFVRDLPRQPASQHIVNAVVSLAGCFGQATVAEGVEDEETRTLLRHLGVDYAQGYAIARPAPVSQVLGSTAAT